MTRSNYKRKCKCKHCHEFFHPDYRNVNRQKYCSKPDCRKASKADSQGRWLNKPENRNYFRGSTNVNRVCEWRKEHPGHARKKAPAEKLLQEPCNKNSESKQNVEFQGNLVLQESCLSQHAVLIGIIAQFTGQVLQDDIAASALRVQQLGQDILNRSHETKGGNDDIKASCLPGEGSTDSGTVQLGGSPSDP